jgi:hypothetical protein
MAHAEGKLRSEAGFDEAMVARRQQAAKRFLEEHARSVVVAHKPEGVAMAQASRLAETQAVAAAAEAREPVKLWRLSALVLPGVLVVK